MSWGASMLAMFLWCALLPLLNPDAPFWLWLILGPGAWAFVIWGRYQMHGPEWRRKADDR